MPKWAPRRCPVKGSDDQGGKPSPPAGGITSPKCVATGNAGRLVGVLGGGLRRAALVASSLSPATRDGFVIWRTAPPLKLHLAARFWGDELPAARFLGDRCFFCLFWDEEGRNDR